jgi:hypothetical protein
MGFGLPKGLLISILCSLPWPSLSLAIFDVQKLTDATQLTGATGNDPILPPPALTSTQISPIRSHRLPSHIARQTNLSHHPLATEAPGIWHITCRMHIEIFLMDRLAELCLFWSFFFLFFALCRDDEFSDWCYRRMAASERISHGRAPGK